MWNPCIYRRKISRITKIALTLLSAFFCVLWLNRELSVVVQRKYFDLDIFTARSASGQNNQVLSVNKTQNKPTVCETWITEISRHVKSKSEDTDNTTKYLVYFCDPGHYCGGWGDRQRAVASTYMLAHLVGREFRLIMDTPCNLSTFYTPRLVNWMPQGDELSEGSSLTIDLFHNQARAKCFYESLMVGNFNEIYTQRVIYLKSNGVFFYQMRHNKLYANKMKWANQFSVYHWAWHRLMQPSKSLVSRVRKHIGSDILIERGLIPSPTTLTTSSKTSQNTTKTSKSQPLICAHVRIGKNPTNPKDAVLTRFRMEDLPILLNFLKEKDRANNAKFFLASDSEEIRGKFRNFFGSSLLGPVGRVTHIDRERSGEAACRGFEVALMEQLVLSVCDTLVFTPSGFSFYASLSRNASEPAYKLMRGKFMCGDCRNAVDNGCCLFTSDELQKYFILYLTFHMLLWFDFYTLRELTLSCFI